MTNTALNHLLLEDQWLWEATAASEEAKQHKLKHVGGGAWANEHGIIVAKTNRKTKQLDWLYGSPDDSSKLTSAPAGALSSQQPTADPDAPQGPTVDKEMASLAVTKLTNYFTQVLDLPDSVNYKTSIVKSILSGKAEIDAQGLTPEQEQDIRDALDEFVLNSKNKLANQIRAYYQAQKIDVKEPEEIPGPESKKKGPFVPKKVGGTGEYTFDGALQAMGVDESTLSSDNVDTLSKILYLAGQAKNQNKLNYIGAKLIKGGLIDKSQWKAFRKYHRNAFGVLPAGKNGDEVPSEPTEPTPTDAPPEEPAAEEDPYEPQVPAIDHPDYKTVAHLFNVAGSNVPIHLATPEQMDNIASAVKGVYYANNNEELKNAIWSIPFLEKGDDEKIFKYMQDTFPNSFPKEEPTQEPEEEPEDSGWKDTTLTPTEHPDYDTVSFWMDKAGAFQELQSVSYDDITGIYNDLLAATQATTYGERLDAIMNLVDSGLLPYANAVALQDAIEDAYPNKSGDPQSAMVKQDVEPDENHPVWGVPMDMVDIVDKAVSALGPWVENDVQFLPKLEKQALANAIVNGYQSGSPNEVDNQFDEVDSKVALAGYQLADIANKVKELIEKDDYSTLPSPDDPSAQPEPEPEETPSAQFTPEEEEFVTAFNDLPDAVRLAAGKFVGEAMKSGIFKEPSQDTDFPKLLATVGKILNGTEGDAYDNTQSMYSGLQSLYDAKLVNPIYSPAMLMKAFVEAKKEIKGSVEPSQEPEVAPDEPIAEPTGDVVPSAAQVAVDGYEFGNAKMVKAVDTSMNGWGGGDADKVMNWVLKKFNASYEPAWKDAAMALVKNFGYDINKVPPELLPVDIKQALENPAPAAPQAPVPSIGDSEVDATPDDYVNNTPAPEEEPITQEPSTPEPTEPETITPKDALGIASGYFSNYGVDIDKLDGAQKVKVVDSIQNALKADTDFGVMYAMQQLKKDGFIKSDLIDGLGIDLLEKLESEGKISDDPDAYKKYLDPKHFTDSFFAQNPSFAASLTDEQKKHINDVVRQGLNLKDDPGAVKGSTTPGQMTGYQKSKQLYKTELADKIPGFTEDIFQKFRNGAMQYHDELKNLTKFNNEKKAAIKQAKEEALQLQKALEALGSGDSAAAISSIADVSGVTDPTMKKKVMVTIAQALQAPTSQLMIDKLNTLSHTNSYSGGNLDGTPSGMTPQAFKTLRSLVAATYFDQNGEDKKINYPEPKVNEPPTVRAQHVFDNWTEKYGMTLGHMPKNTSYYNAVGERQAVRDAVVQALQEPDQKKVNSILNSLFVTASSLTDKQINQLRQLVHDERKSPASLDPNKKFTAPQKYKAGAPTPTTTGGALPDKDISNDPEYKKKSVYYKLPDQKKKEVHDAIFSTLGTQINTWNKASKTNVLQYQLQNLGMDAASARKVALWAVRENMQNGALAQKAKNISAAHNNAASVSSYGGKTLPPPGNEEAAKQFVSSLDSSQDKHELASVEYVKGERVMVNSSLQWTGKANSNSNDYSQDLNAQKAWRAKNRSPEDLQKFQDGMSSWLGSGQWSKPAQQRKALNEIMTRMVEGPPPQYSQVKTFVERGMSMSPEDFKDYIKAFKVGEPVYIGPSGFSANTGTAYGFGASPNNQNAEYVKVLMRVKPDKTGKIKMVRLDPFGSEQECVVGTNRQTRCTNVIKHVTYTGGQAMVAYEIELEYDESITEGKLLGESVGFNMNYWKGLSKETIKAMIKYNNSSVHTKWDK